MKHLTLAETDTFDEVNRAINMLIDNLALIEAKVCQLAKGPEKPKKQAKERGKK